MGPLLSLCRRAPESVGGARGLLQGCRPHRQPEPQVQVSPLEPRTVPAPIRACRASREVRPKLQPGCPARRLEPPPPRPPRGTPVSPRPGPAGTCGLSRGRSSSWEAPPMVFHRSLTIFRQDRWRGRWARRAAAERKGAEVGAGSLCSPASRLGAPHLDGPGQRAGVRMCVCACVYACRRVRGCVRATAGAGAREPPAARRPPAARAARRPRSRLPRLPCALLPPPSLLLNLRVFFVSDSLCLLLLPRSPSDTHAHTADSNGETPPPQRLINREDAGGPRPPGPAREDSKELRPALLSPGPEGLENPGGRLLANFLPGRTRANSPCAGSAAPGRPRGRPRGGLRPSPGSGAALLPAPSRRRGSP